MLPRPNATYSEDLYRFHWKDFGVECILEGFSARKDDIACEATFSMEHPSLGGRLYSGRLLLIGPNSRRDVRKELESCTEEIPWGGLLEQTCQMARERYRRGEPVIKLSEVLPEGQRRFLYDRFILDGAISILYGDGATAKSSLALKWGVEVSLEHGPVLYLDWEDDAATHSERLYAICTAMKMDANRANIFYQRRVAKLADSVREIRRVLAEKGIVLVIVDSLGMAAGDPNNHEYLIEAVRACRSLGIAVLAIHHLPKNATDKSKPFGSGYASHEARLTWLIEKAQEEEAEELNVLLTNYKSNRTRLYGKKAFRISFESGEEEVLMSLHIVPENAAIVDSFRPKLALWKHIQAVLKRPLSVSEIKKALAEDGRETSESNIRRAIHDHTRDFVNISETTTAIWANRDYQRTVAHGGVREGAR